MNLPLTTLHSSLFTLHSSIILNAPYKESVVSVRGVPGDGRVWRVHAMRPGLAEAVWSGGPKHDGEVAEVELDIVEAGSGEEGIETGVVFIENYSNEHPHDSLGSMNPIEFLNIKNEKKTAKFDL